MIWEIVGAIIFIGIFLPDIIDFIADTKIELKRLDDVLKGRRKR